MCRLLLPTVVFRLLAVPAGQNVHVSRTDSLFYSDRCATSFALMSVYSDFAATVQGYPLEAPGHPIGALRRTSPDCNVSVLRESMEEDGYVYLPGFFDRAAVLGVRRELIRRLERTGVLAEDTDPMDGVLRAKWSSPLVANPYRELARGNVPLDSLLYGGRMMALWQSLLGGEVLHFDYTWLRAVPPGSGTPAHTDIVFMGRGTRRLYTAWVPYGDIPLELGGLAILEHGHKRDAIRLEYATRDADTYCENTGESPTTGPDPKRALLDSDPAHLREVLGGQWLTSSYEAGDLLIFGMFTPHVGIDNRTSDRLRISSDSRYQLASETADPRWVGSDPIGHGPDAKVGLIC